MITGIGWRHAHERALLEGAAALPFIEVHSENFFAEGGAARALLRAARDNYPVSLHGVGLALGSAAGLDEWHLDHLAALVREIDPVRVSDHACFARAALRGEVVHGGDLLPIAFTEASLHVMVSNVQRAQERLARPIGVENLSAYLGWADDTLAEPQFLVELARRSGCWLLLDVNNLVVNALNGDAATTATTAATAAKPDAADAAKAACAFVDAIDPALVGQIHLAGYNDRGPLVIDDHGSCVKAPVWRVFRHAIARLGPKPTLVEWDTALPPFEVLLAEAREADRVALALQA